MKLVVHVRKGSSLESNNKRKVWGGSLMLGLFEITEASVSTRHDTDTGVESFSDTPWAI